MEELKSLADKSYAERANIVFGKFLTDFTPEEISYCTSSAYSTKNFETENIAELTQAFDNANILELWHGPTCAFKDMALQILPLLKASKMCPARRLWSSILTRVFPQCRNVRWPHRKGRTLVSALWKAISMTARMVSRKFLLTVLSRKNWPMPEKCFLPPTPSIGADLHRRLSTMFPLMQSWQSAERFSSVM